MLFLLLVVFFISGELLHHAMTITVTET